MGELWLDARALARLEAVSTVYQLESDIAVDPTEGDRIGLTATFDLSAP
jgi:hypothetical protein